VKVVNVLIATGIVLLMAGCATAPKAEDRVSMLEQNMNTLKMQSAKPGGDLVKLATDTEALVADMKAKAPDAQKPMLASIEKHLGNGKQSLIDKKYDLAEAYFSDGASVVTLLKPKK
jgi:hypothetical protein